MSLSTLLRASRACSLGVALTVLWSAPAMADTHLEVGALTADGLSVQDLTCDVEAGGFMAGIAIVGALAGQRDAIAKCGPNGEAARLSFVFKKTSTTGVKVLGASSKPVGACVSKALSKVKPSTIGTCTATILTADNDAAKTAAADLSPNKPATPSEASPAKDQPTEPAPTDKGPAKLGAGDTSAAELLAIYTDNANWRSYTSDVQGWTLYAPKDSKHGTAVVDVDGQTWEHFSTAHEHLYTYVYYHPTAVLTPAVLQDLVAHGVNKGNELTWSPVANKGEAKGGIEIVIEKAFAKSLRFIRVRASSKVGTHFIVAAFPANMPDAVVVKCMEGVRFFTPEKPDAAE